MIEVGAPGSVGWWFHRLLKRLGDRQDRFDRLDRYYRGDPDLPWGPANVKQTFRAFQSKARINFPELIVDAVRERMKVTGFRTGAEGDDNGDADAWRIWQANSLDADSKLVHRDALSMSLGYVIVGGVDKSIGAPVITPEDPRQVITECDPVQRRKVRAGLKVFSDDASQADLAYLYLPGRVIRAQRVRENREGNNVSFDPGAWDFADQQLLPAAVVPVVEFPNRPKTGSQPMGEFESSIDSIDRINVMVLQRMMIAITQAFRQRAAKGDLPTTDDQGNPIDYGDIFTADPGALWLIPSGVELWESSVGDLTPILESVKADIRDLAATTRTPLHYLFPDAANGSAEGASLMREGLIYKVQDREDDFSESWERVMSLAFLFAGDQQRAQLNDLEAMWMQPDRSSLAEKYDAAVKAVAAEVPWRTRMTEILGFSPQQVARMEAERAADQLFSPVAPVAVEPQQAPNAAPAEVA
jgi:hypothetical protein